jgi:phage baseplate assembly protein W
VKNLIMTNRLEKPFNPSFGADIRGLLFELVDYTDGFMLKERIIQSIRQYEPRAEITDISVKGNDVYKNTVNATVTFRIISTAEVVQFSTNLVRLR